MAAYVAFGSGVSGWIRGAANCFQVDRPYYDPRYYFQAMICSIVSLGLCLLALTTLVRAHNKGYSSQRSQLAVVILFFAFVGPVLLVIEVASYYLRK